MHSLSTPLIRILFLVPGAAIALLWVYLAGGLTFFTNLARTNWLSIVPLFGLTTVCILCRFIRWQFLLRRVGVRVPVRSSLSIFLASLVGIATPAYLGEGLRVLLMKQKFGIPVGGTILLMVLERLFDVVELAGIALLAMANWKIRGFILVLLSIASLGIAALINLLNFEEGEPQASRVTILLQTALLTLIAWVPASFCIWIASRALPVSLDLLTGSEIFATATLVGGLTLAPAGIGTTGTIGILLLGKVGVTLPQSVLLISLVRLGTVGWALSCGAIFLLYELRHLRSKTQKESVAAHFDRIANKYENQFAPHIWNHLLDRRIHLLLDQISSMGCSDSVGLDVGCGLARHCRSLTSAGYKVIGIDLAHHLLQQGAHPDIPVTCGSALALPFADSSFDFVYTIGCLHHIQRSDLQEGAISEATRVLRPGGRFLVQETNTRNPLFRFYMEYIFPLTKSIDEGIESWIDPARWNQIEGMRVVQTEYFTFLPDFLPAFLMKSFLSMQRFLEGGRLRFYSVHYMVVLEKNR